MLSLRQPSSNKGRHYRASVVVYNTDRRLIDAIVERTGIARVYTHTRAPQENRKKTSYSWRMASTDIREWGPRLLPWLVCKREQMELLLEHLELAKRNTPRSGWTLDVDARDRRDEIVLRISELNRKGRFQAQGGDA